MKKTFFSILVLMFLSVSCLILNSTEQAILISGDPVIVLPPVKGPVPTQDKPTKKKLAVISNFDLERSSSAFTV
jgi:hypothetical protein